MNHRESPLFISSCLGQFASLTLLFFLVIHSLILCSAYF